MTVCAGRDWASSRVSLSFESDSCDVRDDDDGGSLDGVMRVCDSSFRRTCRMNLLNFVRLSCFLSFLASASASSDVRSSPSVMPCTFCARLYERVDQCVEETVEGT